MGSVSNRTGRERNKLTRSWCGPASSTAVAGWALSGAMFATLSLVFFWVQVSPDLGCERETEEQNWLGDFPASAKAQAQALLAHGHSRGHVSTDIPIREGTFPFT